MTKMLVTLEVDTNKLGTMATLLGGNGVQYSATAQQAIGALLCDMLLQHECVPHAYLARSLDHVGIRHHFSSEWKPDDEAPADYEWRKDHHGDVDYSWSGARRLKG